jgi:membrane protease YdiL (CAAX protease family)
MSGLGGVLGALLAAALGVQFSNPLVELRPGALPTSWLPMAWALTQALSLQYAGVGLLAGGILLARRELNPTRVGLTRNGHSISSLMRLGVVLGCLLAAFSLAVVLADARWDLGPTEPWREALLNAPQTWDYWILMAVISYGLVPVLEEAFYRGVLQGRLQQSLPPAPSILLSSTVFALGHAQYRDLSLFNAATLLTVFVAALVLGWLFWRTGSLYPGIVSHAILNLPPQHGRAGLVLLGALLAILIATRRQWLAQLAEVQAQIWPLCLERLHSLALLATVAFALSLTLMPAPAVPAAVIMLLGGLVAEGRAGRSGTSPG